MPKHALSGRYAGCLQAWPQDQPASRCCARRQPSQGTTPRTQGSQQRRQRSLTCLPRGRWRGGGAGPTPTHHAAAQPQDAPPPHPVAAGAAGDLTRPVLTLQRVALRSVAGARSPPRSSMHTNIHMKQNVGWVGSAGGRRAHPPTGVSKANSCRADAARNIQCPRRLTAHAAAGMHACATTTMEQGKRKLGRRHACAVGHAACITRAVHGNVVQCTSGPPATLQPSPGRLGFGKGGREAQPTPTPTPRLATRRKRSLAGALTWPPGGFRRSALRAPCRQFPDLPAGAAAQQRAGNASKGHPRQTTVPSAAAGW